MLRTHAETIPPKIDKGNLGSRPKFPLFYSIINAFAIFAFTDMGLPYS